MNITVAIPTIPPRSGMLRKAVSSVMAQTRPAAAVSIAVDLEREGSAATRNRALEAVHTDWVAFLDDDDVLLPNHLELLAVEAERTGADVVYPLPRVIDRNGNTVPRRLEWGGGPTFNGPALERRSYICVTSLVRTKLARKVGGFRFITDSAGLSNDDHGFYLALHKAGARFAHVHQETFLWHHHGANTSGQPTRW